MIKWEVTRYGKWYHAMSNAGHSFSTKHRWWMELKIWWYNLDG